MGTILASKIMKDAETKLNDNPDNRVWPDSEMFDDLNLIQNEIIFYKPEANVVNEPLVLVAGIKQTIPATGFQLIKIGHNMGTDGQTLGPPARLVNKDRYDQINPDWYTKTESATVDVYMFDPRDPTRFYVSPPQPSSDMGYVEQIYSAPVADMQKDGDTYDVAINLNDIYRPVMFSLLMFKCYSKDAAKSVEAASRAVTYWNYAMTLLDRKDLIEKKISPKKIYIPNIKPQD